MTFDNITMISVGSKSSFTHLLITYCRKYTQISEVIDYKQAVFKSAFAGINY